MRAGRERERHFGEETKRTKLELLQSSAIKNKSKS